MTHDLLDVERVNSGSFRTVFATLDITSLDAANSESFDPAAELGLDTVLGVSVAGVENAGSYIAQFDYVAGNSLVVEGYGGTDPTAGTAVGQVRVRVDGEPSA